MRHYGILGVSMLAWALVGCTEQSTADADSDIDTDVDTDADADADTDADGDGETLRIIFLDLIAPDALDNVIVEGLINRNIDDYMLNWLIDLGPADGGTCDYRTGASRPDPTDCTSDCGDFTLETDYPPGSGTGDCSDTEFRIPSGTDVIEAVDIPIRDDEDIEEIFLVLPLRDAVLGGPYGAPGDAHGTIDAKITVLGALDIPIEDLGRTLCGLLARDQGENGNMDDDCLNIQACLAGGDPPDPKWDCDTDGELPDTEAGGEPAWTLQGEYEALYVNLTE